MIERGEKFLAEHPATDFRKEVTYLLAVANESWWSTAHAKPDDPWVSAPPYPHREQNARQAEAARAARHPLLPGSAPARAGFPRGSLRPAPHPPPGVKARYRSTKILLFLLLTVTSEMPATPSLSMRMKFLVFLTLASSAFCQTLPPGVQKKASVGGITEYDYPNGLRVLLYPDPANPKVTVNVTYLVGSRHEGYGETGMAHLLEHMDFIETTNGRQIKNEIVAHGANWNGTTSYDRTNYYETVTATDDNLQVGPRPRSRPHGQRQVHQADSRHRNDRGPQRVRARRKQPAVHPQRARRRHRLPLAQLRQVHHRLQGRHRKGAGRAPGRLLHKYYQPDNAVLVITGRLDESKTLQFVADTVGQIPRPTRKLDQTYTVEPAQDGERFVELRRVGTGQEVIVAYHAPAAGHPDAAALRGALRHHERRRWRRRGGRGGGGGGALKAGSPRRWWTTSWPIRPACASSSCTIPAWSNSPPTLTNDQSLDAAKKAIYQSARRHRQRAAHQGGSGAREDRHAAQPGEQLSDAQTLGVTGLTTPISQGDWRLMFLQHDRLKGHARGPGARRQDLFQGIQSHRRLLHSRCRARSHRRCPPRPT